MSFSHRYRVLRELGRRPSSSSYLAEDRAGASNLVTLKTLPPGRSMDSLTRDFDWLLRLRHPSLAAYHDLGKPQDEGDLYTVREFVQGRDVVSASEGSSFAQVVPLLLQILRGLRFLHSRGLVHGRLKAANVLVSDDPFSPDGVRVKLLDWGLAARYADESPGAPALERGSGHPGPSADHSSLGDLLHRVLIDAPRPRSVRGRRRPRISDTPRELGPLLAALMDPTPSRRSGAAIRLEAVCRRLAGEPAIDPAAARFSSRLVDRTAGLATLQGLARELATQGGVLTPLAVLSGEPGTGKSRVLEAFRLSCLGSGIPVLSAACAGEPARGSTVVRQLLDQIQLQLTPFEPAAARLSEIDSTRGDRFLGRALDLFFEASHRHSPVLLIDDCDLADESTSRFLSTLIDHLRFRYFELGRGSYRAPFLLVLAGREQTELPRSSEWFAIPHRQVALGRWDEQGVREHLMGALNMRRAPEALTRLVYELSAGVPRRAEEALSYLARRGALRLQPSGWRLAQRSVETEAPPDDDLLASRLAELPAASRSVLEAASVLGGFELPPLQRLSGMEEQQITAQLEHLLGEGLLRRTGDGRQHFAHRDVAASVYRAMGAQRRVELHGRSAAFLEQVGDAEDTSAIVGRHLARAGDYRGSLDRLRQAARSAHDGGEPDRCRELASLALEQLAEFEALPQQELLELLSLRGRSHAALGRAAEALDDLARALQLVTSQTLVATRCEVMSALGRQELAAGHKSEGSRLIRRALRLARRSGSPELLLEGLGNMGMAHMECWDGSRARTYFEEAAELARQTGNSERKAKALMDLAYCHHALEEPRRSLEIVSHVAELCTAGESTRPYGDVMYRLGGAQYFCSRYGEAYDSLREALRIFTHFGDRPRLARTLNLLGLTCMAIGLFGEAREHLELSLAVAREGGAPAQVFFALAHLGVARSYADAERGRDLMLEALRMVKEARAERYAAPYLHRLGRLLLSQRQRQAAREPSSRLDEIVARYGSSYAWPYAVHLRWLLVEEASRDPKELGRDLRKLERRLVKTEVPQERYLLLRFMADLLRLRGDEARARERARGGLEVWDSMGRELDAVKRQAHLQHPDRLELVEMLGGSTAALTDSSTRKMTRRELDALCRISHSVSSLKGLSAQLERLLDVALETTGRQRGAVLLLEEGRFTPLVRRRLDAAAERTMADRVQEQAAAGFKYALSDPGRHQTPLCLPLAAKGITLGALYLDARAPAGPSVSPSAQFLTAFADIAAVAVENARLLEEVEHDRQRLRAEKEGLKELLGTRGSRYGLVGDSRALQEVRELIEKAAGADVNVLITGQTGTGKELVARAIHDNSPRRDGPFVAVNCAALVESLLEAELFGVEAGAATGVEPRLGRFELASGGTLFLDEVSEMSLASQAKLLRVIQEKKLRRIGGVRELTVDCRFVAASNTVLELAMGEGRFRADLLYRLAVFPIHLPPLSERPEDIPLLMSHFIERATPDDVPTPSVSPSLVQALVRHAWPGNVRELENLVTRLLLLGGGGELRLEDLPPAYRGLPGLALEQAIREGLTERELLSLYARLVLERQGGSKTRTIRVLGIDYKTLQRRLKQ